MCYQNMILPDIKKQPNYTFLKYKYILKIYIQETGNSLSLPVATQVEFSPSWNPSLQWQKYDPTVLVQRCMQGAEGGAHSSTSEDK